MGVVGSSSLPADRPPAGQTTTTSTTTTTAPAEASRASVPDQAANLGSRGATLTVDGKGTVHVVWRAQSTNVTPATDNALFLSTSTDQGRTFAGAAGDAVGPPGSPADPTVESPRGAGRPGGSTP